MNLRLSALVYCVVCSKLHTLLKAATLGSKIYSSRGVWIARKVTVILREFKEFQVCEGTKFPLSVTTTH